MSPTEVSSLLAFRAVTKLIRQGGLGENTITERYGRYA
jgi:hypothetical protein